jgi:hypothetical protein
MSLYIYPYKLASKSARALRTKLSSITGKKVLLVKPDGKFKPRRGDKVINFGNSTLPNWEFAKPDKNFPTQVAIAANKLLTLQRLHEAEIPVPEFTTNREEAQQWVNDSSTVVVRHTLTGHSGQGIEIIQEGEVPNAPLYTKYRKKRAEYRVHVIGGQVIDTVQKKKRNAEERPSNFSTFVRSHSTGWVFCRDGVNPCPVRDATSVAAVAALSLDFGAVDIIYNEHENKYYVLEVNTAPGLEGTTLDKYAEALLELQ